MWISMRLITAHFQPNGWLNTCQHIYLIIVDSLFLYSFFFEDFRWKIFRLQKVSLWNASCTESNKKTPRTLSFYLGTPKNIVGLTDFKVFPRLPCNKWNSSLSMLENDDWDVAIAMWCSVNAKGSKFFHDCSSSFICNQYWLDKSKILYLVATHLHSICLMEWSGLYYSILTIFRDCSHYHNMKMAWNHTVTFWQKATFPIITYSSKTKFLPPLWKTTNRYQKSLLPYDSTQDMEYNEVSWILWPFNSMWPHLWSFCGTRGLEICPITVKIP